MASIERVDELPRTVSSGSRPPLWKAMVKALQEGYDGWLKTNVPNEKEANKLRSRLRYYAQQTRTKVRLEFRRRRTADGTYDVYGRLSKKDGTEPSEE